MRLLKQSSTAQPLMFLLVQSSDHITGLTGASPTVTISKSGGAFASPSGAVSEVANGWYKVAGNATDTGTLGPLVLHATAASADPVDIEYEVVAVDPQSATAFITGVNSLSPPSNWNLESIDGSGRVLLQPTQSGVTIPTVTTVTNQLTAAQIATGVWQDSTAGDFTTASSIGKSLYTTGVVPGASGGLFIAGSNAGTTVNFTGNLSGSVGSVTSAVTLPSIPTNWITAAGINAAALNGKGDWLLSSSYTAPDNSDIAAIKTKTDFLPSATAGAAGGLFIAGSNAATTVASLTSTGRATFGGMTIHPSTGIALLIQDSGDGSDTVNILNNTGAGADTFLISNAGGNGSFALSVLNQSGEAANFTNEAGGTTVQIFTTDSTPALAISNFKPAVTLNASDVTGNLPANLLATNGHLITSTGAFSFDAQTTSQTTMAKLATMLTASGPNSTYTVDALKNAPSGGGGGGGSPWTVEGTSTSVTDR